MIEMRRRINMVDFRIGNGRLTFGAPVDNLFPAVDITFFIQAAKGFQDRIGTAFVHRKTHPVPIAGAAQLVQLVQYDAAVFLFPFPDALQKAFPANVCLCQPLLCHFLCDLHLCGDAGMVDAGYPERVKACHAFPANQDILHGVIQRVPHVQLPCDIRGRHYDAVGFFASIDFCVEIFPFHPCFIEPFLNRRGVEIFCQLFHAFSSCFRTGSESWEMPDLPGFCRQTKGIFRRNTVSISRKTTKVWR